jgi:hypothetical protein
VHAGASDVHATTPEVSAAAEAAVPTAAEAAVPTAATTAVPTAATTTTTTGIGTRYRHHQQGGHSRCE